MYLPGCFRCRFLLDYSNVRGPFFDEFFVLSFRHHSLRRGRRHSTTILLPTHYHTININSIVLLNNDIIRSARFELNTFHKQTQPTLRKMKLHLITTAYLITLATSKTGDNDNDDDNNSNEAIPAQIGELPGCSIKCLADAVTAAKCTETDYACRCGPKMMAIPNAVLRCVQKICPAADTDCMSISNLFGHFSVAGCRKGYEWEDEE